MSFVPFVSLSQRDVKSTHSTKQNPLGTMGITQDGRKYAYALAGEALSVGIPLNPIERGGLAAAGLTVINNETEDLTSTWTSITLSSTNSTWGAVKDEYADGYLVIEDSTHSITGQVALGQMVKVKSNTAGSTSTTDSPYATTVTFYDDDKLLAGLDTGPTIQVVHNMYFDVIEHDGGATTLPIIGVPNCDVADNYYFWAQTWGPCPVLEDASTLVYGELAIGSTNSDQGLQPLQAGNATNATDALYTSVVRPNIGWVLGPAGGDNDYTLIFLTIHG
jgi:hypothetical protein